MLHGPICPIYGFGALIILFGIYPWRETWFRLFVASAILASILEYFSSWLLETIFHTKWWDYSAHKFNLNGRICLLNSCAFGLGGVALEHFLHPIAVNLIFAPKIQPFIPSIYYAFSTILGIDVIFTIKARIESGSIQASEKMRERLEKFSRRQRNEESLFRKFPTMSSREYKLPLDHIKQTLKEYIEKKRNERLSKIRK